MSRFAFCIILTSSLVITACSPNSPSDPFAALSIDEGITGESRTIIGNQMLKLGEDQRDNVIYVTNSGKIYSNRMALLQQYGVYSQTEGGPTINADGQTVRSMSIPSDLFEQKPSASTSGQLASQATIACTTGDTVKTGAYRRIYSTNGYKYQSSYIFLPSDQNGNVKDSTTPNTSFPKGDTAFIYLGGWGTNGGAVDAGFQHGHYLSGTTDDWAPFISYENGTDSTGKPVAATVRPNETQSGGRPLRFAANQQVFAKFFVGTDVNGAATINLHVTGVTNLDGTKTTATLIATPLSYYQWGGTGNVLKRMTTIAQVGATQSDFNTGAFIKNVTWSSSTIGQSSSTATTWGAANTGGYCSYPDPSTTAGQSTTAPNKKKIDVQFVSAAEETDNIYLLP